MSHDAAAIRPEVLYPWNKARPLFGDIGRSTAWRMVRDGQLPPPVKLCSGRVAWRESDILAWQARQFGKSGRRDHTEHSAIIDLRSAHVRV